MRSVILLSTLIFSQIFCHGNKYTISIVPQTSADKIENKWSPILKHIEANSNLEFSIVHHVSIEKFEESVAAGIPDFAYMNPFHAFRAKQLQGYEPIIRDKTKMLFGQLWVNSSSKFQTVKDLDGTKMVFPAPNAFGASLYMRALLREKEEITFSPKYVKTHSNVYRHVAMGRSAAGGGVARTYNAEPENLRENLRLIYQTPGVRPHPICTHPRVPKEDRETFISAVISLLNSGEDGAKKLKNIAIPEPVRSQYETDYLQLGDLNLSKYVEGAMR
ncbi:MAG: phosphate/phosphite/phosphonate ABC transporter substrate-binding protein [Verrucomicrobiota bacterium]